MTKITFVEGFASAARGYFKAFLHSAPWIALAVIGYLFLFSDVKNMDMNLGFQAYKVCWAMILTALCDKGLFYMVPGEGDGLISGDWSAQIRRAVVFLGICHLLQIA